MYKLSVVAADITAEISILDGGFDEVAAGVHRVRRDLAPGIYKIRVRVGPNLREELVSLTADRTVRFLPARVASPVPLHGFTGTRAKHVAAAIETSKRPTGSLGEGGSAFVFVRDAPVDGAPPVGSPAAGLTFRRWGTPAGDALDVAALADVRPLGEGCAGWSVSAAPGLYVLSLEEADGRTTERPVTVSARRQTQVFMVRRRRGAADAGSAPPDLAQASVIISATGSFMPNERQGRLAELALHALTNNRKVLSDELRTILRGKFDDPVLGLIGLHLLVRDEPEDRARIDAVASNLAGILGDDNPDLRAVALWRSVIGGTAAPPITDPPALRAGWDLVVAASTRRPVVLAAGSPAADIATRVLPGGPWLTWLGGTDDARTDRELVIVDILTDYVRSQVDRILARTPPAGPPDQTPAPPAGFFFERAGRFAGLLPAPKTSFGLDLAGPAAGAQVEAARAALAQVLSPAEVADLARTFGVPCESLSGLLKKAARSSGGAAGDVVPFSRWVE